MRRKRERVFSVTLQKTSCPVFLRGSLGEMVIIQRVEIYSKALVVEYGEVDKDLGVGEGENLLRKIDSF